MQPIPDIQDDLPILNTDLFHVISPFIPDRDLYSLVRSGKEVSGISRRYLRPTQEDFNKALRAGDILVVENLLGYSQIDPSGDNNFAIRFASTNGHTKILKVLLEEDRVDPTVDNNMAIQLVSANGHTEVVKLLLQDERVDPSDDYKYAIRYTSHNGYTGIARLLLKDPKYPRHTKIDLL